MSEKPPPEIIGRYRVVRGPREPIVNDWGGLAMFFGVPLALLVVRLGQIKGWW